jgi:ethanolamine utilization protein EutA
VSIKPILSVGIDVGTTSTHLTISRLFLTNASRATEPERIVIDRREIIYQSPIRLTPLSADGAIDADGVFRFLSEQYNSAGVQSCDITSGAVIVTGETARLRNADAVAEKLSSMAGQFVVASAGPNLESILAARGSGAADYSKANHKTVCNIDIGGGTSNLAIFSNGDLLANAAISVGGRMIRVTAEMQVLGISQSGQTILDGIQQRLQIGELLDAITAAKIADHAAALLVELLTEPFFTHPLMVTAPLDYGGTIDEYWFSGGVAELFDAPLAPGADTQYGDIGSFLARSLKHQLTRRSIVYSIPGNPIRATVTGAGLYSMQLTGSTVSVASEVLPLCGLPLIRPFRSTVPRPHTDWREHSTQARPGVPDLLIECLTRTLVHNDVDWAERPIAILLPVDVEPTHQSLRMWAQALARAYMHFGALGPFTVLCSRDIGAALGQLLRSELPGTALICLDGIDDMPGDFIDIGLPVANKRTIPVVIKDLLFG